MSNKSEKIAIDKESLHRIVHGALGLHYQQIELMVKMALPHIRATEDLAQPMNANAIDNLLDSKITMSSLVERLKSSLTASDPDTSLTAKQKRYRFEKLFVKMTINSYRPLSSRIPQDTWVVLDITMSDNYQGTFSIGDYSSFNSNSKVQIAQSTFAKWLRDLVKLGLLTRSIVDPSMEDDGFKRDVFSVTAKGALVHYARYFKNETQSLAPINWLRRVHF